MNNNENNASSQRIHAHLNNILLAIVMMVGVVIGNIGLPSISENYRVHKLGVRNDSRGWIKVADQVTIKSSETVKVISNFQS